MKRKAFLIGALPPNEPLKDDSAVVSLRKEWLQRLEGGAEIMSDQG